MSDDPLIKRLSELKPDGSGLDRDALLFAAGRASARTNRRWLAAAGVLAATQAITLAVVLWPRPLVPLADPIKNDPPIVATDPPAPAPTEPEDAPSPWALRNAIIAAEGKMPSPDAVDLVPSQPPLSVFGPPPADLVN
jgi:hypothetical protein